MKKLLVTMFMLFFCLTAKADTYTVTDYCSPLQVTHWSVPVPAGAHEMLVRATDELIGSLTFTTNGNCDGWYQIGHHFSIQATSGSTSATQQFSTPEIDGHVFIPDTNPLIVPLDDLAHGGLRFPLGEGTGSTIDLGSWSTVYESEQGNCGDFGVSAQGMCTKTLHVNFR